VEILEDDCHIKVLDAEGYSLEVNSLDVLQVDHEERELGHGDQAVFGRSDLDDRFQRAALEVEVLVRHIEVDGMGGLVSLLLDQLCEVMELGGELLLGPSFSLLLLELVEVVSSPAASHVDVIGNDT